MKQYQKLSPLLKPFKLGNLELKNRAVMAALTRKRANIADGIPTEDFIKYYSARASAGLIVTESIPVSQFSNPKPGAGCLYTDEQEAGWQRVVDAVHREGGLIFAQLFHGGRVCLPEDTGGAQPLGASDIPLSKKYNNPSIPKAATLEDIENVKKDFLMCTKRAKRAGFDGIELLAANGFLLDQFIRDCTNNRKDQYGGSVENRARLLLEIIDQASQIFDYQRIGVKLTLLDTNFDMKDSNPDETLANLIKEFNHRKLAFLEYREGEREGPITQVSNPMKSKFKKQFQGIWIANNGYSFETANADIEKGEVDMVSFGKLFILNPDLIFKFQNGLELLQPEQIKDKEKLMYYFRNNDAGSLGYTDLSVYQQLI